MASKLLCGGKRVFVEKPPEEAVLVDSDVRRSLVMVSSHHMAHSIRGSRSTGSKFITARNRST